MSRKFEDDHLLVASHNEGKVGEIRTMLMGKVARVLSAGEAGISEPEETEDSFIGNAVLKAKSAAEESGQVSLADDSGLAVEALGGRPGIYSARYAEKDGVRDFDYGMQRLQAELEGQDNYNARFVCAMALCWPDGHVESVEGDVQGKLVFPARGPSGFGYDPIFLPHGYDKTFGEMSKPEKQAISHRADAFQKIMQKCFV